MPIMEMAVTRAVRPATAARGPAAGSSHRTRTQGDCGGMLTAYLIDPDDLDAVTRVVVSHEG